MTHKMSEPNNNEEKTRRYAEDFELWARECVKIVDKESGREVPFRLNAPQRRVLAAMEKMRRSRRPVRVIMLKARQWGGSTLVQIYMAWLQLVVCRGWNSVTCAHVKDASAAIRGMYTRLLRCYPEELKTGKPKDWELAPYEKSQSIGYVGARDCLVGIATSMAPNSVRGYNFAMAHLSEVAFWADGDARCAEEIVRTLCGTVLRVPDSVVVMESTANGKDNYFYREWERAVAGESDKLAIFVPWHEIELYRREVSAAETGRVVASFDEYERNLLADGVAIEAVAWYHDKRREYQTHEAMMAEFPSTPEEAFATSRRAVFPPDILPPVAEKGSERPALGILIPGEEGWTLSLAAMDSGGTVCMLGDTSGRGDCGEGAAHAARVCRDAGIPVMIVEGADCERSHAAWCARTVALQGASLCYDEEDIPWFRPCGDTLSEWTDTLLGRLRSGLLKECDGGVLEEYRNFRFDRPMRTPRVLARLGAAWFLRHGISASDYNSLL